MKPKKAKIAKKQLKACHLYIAEQLAELGLQHWRTGMGIEKHHAIKEKNGHIYVDMKKVKKC